MVGLMWVFAILGALIGGAWFALGAFLTASAPQSAAVAAQAMCWAVIPYVLARGFTEIAAEGRRRSAEKD